jgi:hypothetical protein
VAAPFMTASNTKNPRKPNQMTGKIVFVINKDFDEIRCKGVPFRRILVAAKGANYVPCHVPPAC